MKYLYLFLLLGCATTNASYHKIGKPYIVEKSINDGKQVAIHNPYDIDILVDVDCDGENSSPWVINVKANKEEVFNVNSDSHCSITSWKTN